MNRELLVKVLESARGRPLGIEDLLVRGGLDPGLEPLVRRELRALVREGRIAGLGKRFAARPAPPKVEAEPICNSAPVHQTAAKAPGVVEGVLRRHRDGYGFINPLDGGDDLFVPPPAMAGALDGDLVRARAGVGRDGRRLARAVEVIERRRVLAVGTYRVVAGAGAWVEPRDRALPPISVPETRVAADGDVVRVKILDFAAPPAESAHGQRGGRSRGDKWLGLTGKVLSRLGRPGDPDAEVLSVAYGEGFSDSFPPDALRAAESVPLEIAAGDRLGRRDLTALPLITIDGEDARDFDDAVFVERTSHGFRAVIAIADVSAYVPENGALDREARRRATSVYFPGHVLPMLPERLSNGICSLNPDAERLCLVADLVLDERGATLDTDLYPAVMKSRARCTYGQVAALLDGDSVPELRHLREMLLVAGELAKRLTERRRARGALDFDLPEMQVKLGPAPERPVVAVERQPRTDAHRLIEELMLAANEAVARYFAERDLPVVYRVHGPPKEEKLRTFALLAGAFGYDIPLDAKGSVSAMALNDFLERVEGRPEQRALHHLLLRSMMQAVYSSENIGHFGLAAEGYLHFSSPIRRYPDLVVHRLLKGHWARAGRVPSREARARDARALEEVAVHCSERERAATSAEREIDAYYAAALMQGRTGQRFPGTVASVAELGLFVELDDPFVEGLVRAETLSPRTRFDERRHRLEAGTRSFGIGDRVEVEVASADPVTRRIDLLLRAKHKRR